MLMKSTPVRDVVWVVNFYDCATQCGGGCPILVDGQHLTTVAQVRGVNVHALFMWFLKFKKCGIDLNQEGATYGPRATSNPRRLHFSPWISLFDMNLARETQINAHFGPRTKIVARPWSKRSVNLANPNLIKLGPPLLQFLFITILW